MPPTLKVLAEQLGTSTAAVSMALRNHPRISEGLRARAKALAKKLGYVPNPAFSRSGAWREKKRPTVGMPVALVWQKHPQPGFGISTYLSNLQKIAGDFGYQLQVHEAGLEDTLRVANILYARGVEAVLIGRIFDQRFIARFPWERFCVVALDVGYFRPPCHLVMPDIAAATFSAVGRALAAGFRRIGLYEFSELADPVDWADRFGAAAAAGEICRAAGADFFHQLAPPYDREAFYHWVDRTKPDIVLGQTPTCFWWLKDHLGPNGETIPSISLQMDPAEVAHGITGFVHDHRALCTVALKLLDGEVRNFERGCPQVATRQLVSMPWNEGVDILALRKVPESTSGAGTTPSLKNRKSPRRRISNPA